MKVSLSQNKFTMKRIYLGILIAIGVILVGAIVDASDIFGKSAVPSITVVATCVTAGMVLGIVFDREWRDSKERKKELFA